MKRKLIEFIGLAMLIPTLAFAEWDRAYVYVTGATGTVGSASTSDVEVVGYIEEIVINSIYTNGTLSNIVTIATVTNVSNPASVTLAVYTNYGSQIVGYPAVAEMPIPTIAGAASYRRKFIGNQKVRMSITSMMSGGADNTNVTTITGRILFVK